MELPNIPQRPQTPKRFCLITLMFPIDDDKEAWDVKNVIDPLITDKLDKRYTFQITDN